MTSAHGRDVSADDAWTAFQVARHESERAIGGTADPQDVYDRSTSLAAEWREASDEIAKLRALAAARVREEESLTLTALAVRLGVSTTRAHQLMQLARQHQR